MLAICARFNFIIGFALFAAGLAGIIYSRFSDFIGFFIFLFFLIIGFVLMRLVRSSRRMVIEFYQSEHWEKESRVYFRERGLEEKTSRNFTSILIGAWIAYLLVLIMLLLSVLFVFMMLDGAKDLKPGAVIATILFVVFPFTFSLTYYNVWLFRTVGFIRKYVPI